MALEYHFEVKSKSFCDANGDNQLIIDNLHLDIEPGEFVTLLGPSGAGKSTLLNIIAGLDEQFDGSIEVSKQNGHTARISLMFQDHRLMPWLTIRKNVMLVCRGTAEEQYKTATQWLEKVGLAGSEEMYPGQLSGGMLKRAALARAFAYEPDILLMDEPFSSLDVMAAGQLRNLMLDLWQTRQPAIVYVTHDISEATSLADRIILLSTHPMQVKEEVILCYPRPRNPLNAEMTELNQQLHVSLGGHN